MKNIVQKYTFSSIEEKSFLTYYFPMYSSYPKYLLRLIEVLKKLPGVGARSAERYAFSLLEKPEKEVFEIIQVMSEFLEKRRFASIVGVYQKRLAVVFVPL